MKRASMRGVTVLVIAVVVLVAACSPSPKSRADDFIKYLPSEVGEWERTETTQLLNSTVSSKGHVIMAYEGADDALAYIIVEVHPSEDAADVAAMTRIRELQLMGLELDRDRAPRQATADIAQDGLVRYALFHEQEITVEVNTLAADDEAPVSDDAFGELLAIVRVAFENVLDE